MKARLNLVVLISGNGSNLQAIIDACSTQQLAATVNCVVANKPEAFGLERARRAGIPTLIKSPSPQLTREAYDTELAQAVQVFQPDLVILAGWMRILSPHFLNFFPTQVINLHPALPGTYPGTQAIARAFNDYNAGKITETGVMVHWVPDAGIDDGPVLAQATVPIFPTDTLATLTERMQETERQLLLEALTQLTQAA